MSLTEEVKEQARSLGFDLVGVAEATPLVRDGARLRAWLAEDRHAGMAWMARDPERRADPRELLLGCTSVIALAVSYWPGDEAAAVPEGRAEVALYARGRDYHRVLGGAAKDLARWLEDRSGLPARACVDTLPVLERAWAERAGLGWIGKNANLLTRTHGSWLMLAEVLAVARLTPDLPETSDFCGSCTACLAACPTQAIAAPGVVDANACIAYWTIEHRGPIPEERRAGIGSRIFGCDVCQDVCPWNTSFARTGDAPPAFGARDDLRGLDPVEVLEMDEPEFRGRWSGTPLMRAKWEGMRRNACVVLGNTALPGDSRSRGALERASADPDPVVREHAAWALESLRQRAFSSRETSR